MTDRKPKNSLNHDSIDLADDHDSKNQANQENQKNQGADKMKQGWERQRLEDCFKLKSGDGLTSKMMCEDGKYPVFGGNGIAGLHDEFNLSGSNVIIGRVGALCGNVRHMNAKVWLTDNAFKITDFKFDFDHSFLTYLLNYKNLREFARQAAQPVISNSSLKEVILEFPKSLPEQQRIVAILDEAFAAIAKAKANAEQNLKNAKELFESYLQGVFEKKSLNHDSSDLYDYDENQSHHLNQKNQSSDKGEGLKFETLDSICELIVDCEHKTAPTQETGYPSIRTPNIGKGVLILEGVNRVSEKTYNEWTRRAIPQADDLILAREAPAGNIAVIPENVKVCLGQRTVLIRPKKNKIVSKYLAYLILSKDVQEQLLSHSTGATVEHINMKDIRAFKIYNLSDVEEQQSIVQKLDALSAETKKLEAIYQKKITDLEELKKSVLQKAFSGELRTVEEELIS